MENSRRTDMRHSFLQRIEGEKLETGADGRERGERKTLPFLKKSSFS
jgi:hypothetical protein